MTAKRFEKLKLALKYYLIGREWTKALEAFAFAEKHHIGLRKDGETPEFQHQIEIALRITTLKNLRNEEKCIIIALLHDIREDHKIQSSEIEAQFGIEVREAVDAMTVKFNGWRKSSEEYYDTISQNVLASIVKGCDREHNLNSMNGVFKHEKKLSYIEEVEAHILPMLKKAADLFPDQHLAYMSIRHSLKSIVSHVRFSLNEIQPFMMAPEWVIRNFNPQPQPPEPQTDGQQTDGPIINVAAPGQILYR